ncbi:kinase-like protein, partial [Paxillus ammoniavirescens]
LVMDHLGSSLEDLMSRNDSSIFSFEAIAEIASQAITVLEFIHSRNFIHHNIKPSHLLLGSGTKQGTVYLIDFRFVWTYRDHGTHRHIPYKKQVPFFAIESFASIRALHGRQQS